MAQSNIVFFGCNYNDKKIKAQFDSLKRRIETDTVLKCCRPSATTGPNRGSKSSLFLQGPLAD